MNTNYMEAFAETDEILKFMSKDLLNRIPLSFRDLISTKKSTDYKFNINPNIPIETQKLKKETKAILSLIYRSYIILPEEKEKLEIKDIEELKQIEKKLREKYNPNKIFNKKETIIELENLNEINQLPIDYSNIKWYQKIYNTILKFFKIR